MLDGQRKAAFGAQENLRQQGFPRNGLLSLGKVIKNHLHAFENGPKSTVQTRQLQTTRHIATRGRLQST